MKVNHLTPAEEQLMHIIWKINSGYLQDILVQYEEPKPHQNTVSTYLKILQQKEYLKIEKEGRKNKYHIAVPLEEYKTFIITHFLEVNFQNSAELLVQHLVQKNLLSESFFTKKQSTIMESVDFDILEKEDKAISSYLKEITKEKKKKEKKNAKKKKKNKLE